MKLRAPELSPLWYRALFGSAVAISFSLLFAGLVLTNSATGGWQFPVYAAASIGLLGIGIAEAWWGLRLRREDPERRR